MNDIELTEKCHECKNNLWLRESRRFDDSKLFLVKWCKTNHCIDVEEICEIVDDKEIENEMS